MRRGVSPRNVYTTTTMRPTTSRPIETKRCSDADGSSTVMAYGSSSTLSASEKRTPCFRKFVAALVGSHTAVTYALYAYVCRGQLFPLSVQRVELTRERSWSHQRESGGATVRCVVLSPDPGRRDADPSIARAAARSA